MSKPYDFEADPPTPRPACGACRESNPEPSD